MIISLVTILLCTPDEYQLVTVTDKVGKLSQAIILNVVIGLNY